MSYVIYYSAKIARWRLISSPFSVHFATLCILAFCPENGTISSVASLLKSSAFSMAYFSPLNSISFSETVTTAPHVLQETGGTSQKIRNLGRSVPIVASLREDSITHSEPSENLQSSVKIARAPSPPLLIIFPLNTQFTNITEPPSPVITTSPSKVVSATVKSLLPVISYSTASFFSQEDKAKSIITARPRSSNFPNNPFFILNFLSIYVFAFA